MNNNIQNLAEIIQDKTKDITNEIINTPVISEIQNHAENIKDSSLNVINKVEEVIQPTFNDILKKILKYIIEGLVVAIAGYYIPSKKPDMSELIIIGLVAASTFAILEVYMPDAYMASKFGFGFQTGRNLIPV